MHASVDASNIQAQFSFVIALVEALAISAVVWLGVWLVDRDAITIGTLVLFILLLQNMFKPARKIVSEWYKIGKVYASVERIDDLLDRQVMVEDLPDAVEAPDAAGPAGVPATSGSPTRPSTPTAPPRRTAPPSSRTSTSRSRPVRSCRSSGRAAPARAPSPS